MKVVILCGGKGTRLREEAEFRPKPMVPIGDRPVLWHIMKIYAHYRHTQFILCLGYRGEIIRDYFRNYPWNTCDVTIGLGRASKPKFHGLNDERDWIVTLAHTGEHTLTAHRIRQIKKYIGRDPHFLLTYGDGVGNIDIDAVERQHKRSGKVCTITAVHPAGRFGEITLARDHTVSRFNEKPQATAGLINGGFMVCSREIFSYLPDDPNVMLEQGPLRALAAEGKLGAYVHEGFWQPMDTVHEMGLLNALWDSGKAPWKIWDR